MALTRLQEEMIGAIASKTVLGNSTGSSGNAQEIPFADLEVNRTLATVNAATYTVTATDDIVHVTYTGTGAVTVTLPSSIVASGKLIDIVDAGGNAGTNNITIDTEASETINGAATKVISTNYDSVNLYSDGTNWFTK